MVIRSREPFAHYKILPCCSIWLANKNEWLVAEKITSTHWKITLLQYAISIQQHMDISREILVHDKIFLVHLMIRAQLFKANDIVR